MDGRFAWRMFASQELGKCDYQSFAFSMNHYRQNFNNDSVIGLHVGGFIKDFKTRWLVTRYCSERLFSEVLYFICKKEYNFYEKLLIDQEKVKKKEDNIWIYQIFYRYFDLYGIEKFNNTLTFICNP